MHSGPRVAVLSTASVAAVIPVARVRASRRAPMVSVAAALCAFTLVISAAFGADAPANASSNAAPPSTTFSVLNKSDRPIEWGGVLVLGVAGTPLTDPEDATKWNVLLNGVSLKVANVLTGAGTDAETPAPDENVYRLVLARIDFSAKAGDKSAGDVAAATIEAVAPARLSANPVVVVVEYDGKPLAARPIPGTNRLRNIVTFRLAQSWEWAVGIAAIVLLVIVMIVAGRRGAILRDEKPAGADVDKRLYSLGRTQLAFWTTMIVGGFIFLYITTGQFWGLLNNTALALLGISAATTALSGVADGSPPPATPPPKQQEHKDFITDILSDAYGMNIHRVQMAIWTVVFGFVFLKQLVTQFSFPEFDATTFGLMGISSATYVWLKRSEP